MSDEKRLEVCATIDKAYQQAATVSWAMTGWAKALETSEPHFTAEEVSGQIQTWSLALNTLMGVLEEAIALMHEGGAA